MTEKASSGLFQNADDGSRAFNAAGFAEGAFALGGQDGNGLRFAGPFDFFNNEVVAVRREYDFFDSARLDVFEGLFETNHLWQSVKIIHDTLLTQ